MRGCSPPHCRARAAACPMAAGECLRGLAGLCWGPGGGYWVAPGHCRAVESGFSQCLKGAVPLSLEPSLGGWPCHARVFWSSSCACSVPLCWGAGCQGGGAGGGCVWKSCEAPWWLPEVSWGGSCGEEAFPGLGARAAASCLPRRWNLPPAAQALASLFSVSLLLLLNSLLPFWPMLQLFWFNYGGFF